MSITVTDPEVALDGLQHAGAGRARRPDAAAYPQGCWPGWLSTDCLDATTCHTLVLTFEVRGGSQTTTATDPTQPWMGWVARSTSCWPWTRPNGPSTSCNARSWTSTPHPAAGRGTAKAPGVFDTRGGAQLAGHRTTGTGWRHPPAPRRGMPAGGSTPPARCVMCCPRPRPRWPTGPSPSTMSGRSAPRTAPSVMR